MRAPRALIFLSVLLALSACQLSTSNSSTGDAQLAPRMRDQNASGTVPENRFVTAKNIVDSKCSTCHFHQEWTSLDEGGFVETGLVVAGSLESSPLYQRLKGIVAGGDMPKGVGNSALTVEEAASLREWILQLAQISDPLPPQPSQPSPPDAAPVTPDAGQRFSAAKALLDARCVTCHAHSDWTDLDEAGYRAIADEEGLLILAGAPESSPMYTRLKGVTPFGNMPAGRNNPALTPEQALVIRDWIARLDQP